VNEKHKFDQLTRRIIGAAIEVHKILGPGLLESAYEACLAFDLRGLGLNVEQQKPLPVIYKEVKLDCGYRLDLVVEDLVIVGVKAIEKLAPISRRSAAFIFETFREASRAPDEFPRSRIEGRPKAYRK
jgi:GxxExxY protein